MTPARAVCPQPVWNTAVQLQQLSVTRTTDRLHTSPVLGSWRQKGTKHGHFNTLQSGFTGWKIWIILNYIRLLKHLRKETQVFRQCQAHSRSTAGHCTRMGSTSTAHGCTPFSWQRSGKRCSSQLHITPQIHWFCVNMRPMRNSAAICIPNIQE